MEAFEGLSEQEVRFKVYESFKETFASAPIRLMSRTVSAMRSMGYTDLASAIGDLDWRTVPADDRDDPFLRDDWEALLVQAFDNMAGWLHQLAARPLAYNLDSLGYPAVVEAWSGMWRRQLAIEFRNRRGKPPEVFVFHGGNQAVQAALVGVAEARRNRVGAGTPATVLVPLPTFSCPMDQIALQGMQAYFLTPAGKGMDPGPEDIARVPDGVDIDGVYAMPVNNPTGRTVEPDRLRALVEAVVDRWPHAGIILDSVYVRMHPRYRQLLAWFDDDPRFAESIIFIDSLSKSHGVTGLRAGALLTRSSRLRDGVLRFAQNVMAGPTNTMQAVVLGLIGPYATGEEELSDYLTRLQLRIGSHLQRRRRLLLEDAFASWGELLDDEQPLLPDPETYDWEGSMYAVPKLSARCRERARERGLSPTVAFYLDTGIGGVPLEGFCRNRNLERHGLVANRDLDELQVFQDYASQFVRLSFGMTPPPRRRRATDHG
ncbi:MAG TPA: pyridoxal phosphate-dependent aminotransferase [Methylomirabilota bacterium]|nr:pyridoxal phosphate-dependent aminotransferase [Methylomirabilota bacterium]